MTDIKNEKTSLLNKIKLRLQSKEKQLEKRKVELSSEDPFADPERLNDNAALDTEASEQFGHERISAINREIDKMLVRVRKSLTRIKLGKYGICEACGKMIDTHRLSVDPTVQYCLPCAQKRSQKVTE